MEGSRERYGCERGIRNHLPWGVVPILRRTCGAQAAARELAFRPRERSTCGSAGTCRILPLPPVYHLDGGQLPPSVAEVCHNLVAAYRDAQPLSGV